MLLHALRKMSRYTTVQRTRLVAQHMMSSSSATSNAPVEPTVIFESNGSARRYILNRPRKLNALDESMIKLLKPKIKEWDESELCRVVVGDGAGKAFCAGGDVATVVQNGADPKTRDKAIDFFKQEFELDYQLASLRKPYIVFCDGHTMGGGVGLTAHAPFRIATENTRFAMPETNIGYSPDVGANYFLPRLDGEIGTYLALTSYNLVGRAVFENGLATHYVPSRRLPQLLAQLTAMEDPTMDRINSAIEELYDDPSNDEVTNAIVGDVRVAVDTAFAHNSVEEIFESLQSMGTENGSVGDWARQTLAVMEMRSPTSLKVALAAIRKGKQLTLAESLRMELGIATAFLTGASPDFEIGVTAIVIRKDRENRPAWSPSTLSEVSQELVDQFFAPSIYTDNAPELELQNKEIDEHHSISMKYALPSESEVEQMVRGTHAQSGALANNVADIIEIFNTRTGNKHGVEDKILEIVARRCEVVDDPDGYRALTWT